VACVLEASFEYSSRSIAVETNPYASPEADLVRADYSSNTVARSSLVLSALVSFVGTVLAAGVMGFGMAGYIGTIFGILFAAGSATPTTFVSFVVVWFFSSREITKRKIVCTSALSGAFSGAIVFSWLGSISAELWGLALVAALLGAGGAAICTWLFVRSLPAAPESISRSAVWGDPDAATEPHGTVEKKT